MALTSGVSSGVSAGLTSGLGAPAAGTCDVGQAQAQVQAQGVGRELSQALQLAAGQGGRA